MSPHKTKTFTLLPHNNLAANLFDLVHCDIWGPFHQVSHTGYRFFLTLVNDHSRLSSVYLMKNKTYLYHLCPRFYAMIGTQFDTKIKIFRYDNAELRFIDFFLKTRTLHQFSCVECPKQNSIVERKHQYLLNVARALYFQSQAPLELWS